MIVGGKLFHGVVYARALRTQATGLPIPAAFRGMLLWGELATSPGPREGQVL